MQCCEFLMRTEETGGEAIAEQRMSGAKERVAAARNLR